MNILCLDLEGVLTPEIWQAVADQCDAPELRKTTRDLADYDELMRFRLDALRRHGLGFSRIQEVIAGLEPLPGAAAFLDRVRRHCQPAIVSDTFYEFASPLMAKLGWPLLLCHHLQVENDAITGYRLRQADAKRQVVAAFKSLDFNVIAAGDSWNDLSMLAAADHGILFQAPETVRAAHPGYPAVSDHAQLERMVHELARMPPQNAGTT